MRRSFLAIAYVLAASCTSCSKNKSIASLNLALISEPKPTAARGILTQEMAVELLDSNAVFEKGSTVFSRINLGQVPFSLNEAIKSPLAVRHSVKSNLMKNSYPSTTEWRPLEDSNCTPVYTGDSTDSDVDSIRVNTMSKLDCAQNYSGLEYLIKSQHSEKDYDDRNPKGGFQIHIDGISVDLKGIIDGSNLQFKELLVGDIEKVRTDNEYQQGYRTTLELKTATWDKVEGTGSHETTLIEANYLDFSRFWDPYTSTETVSFSGFYQKKFESKIGSKSDSIDLVLKIESENLVLGNPDCKEGIRDGKIIYSDSTINKVEVVFSSCVSTFFYNGTEISAKVP